MLQIKKTLVTHQGFEVKDPVCFLEFYFLGRIQFINFFYYKSKEDCHEGAPQLIFPELPGKIDLKISSADFFEDGLITNLHNICKNEIEAITGKKTVNLVTE